MAASGLADERCDEGWLRCWSAGDVLEGELVVGRDLLLAIKRGRIIIEGGVPEPEFGVFQFSYDAATLAQASRHLT